MKRFYVFAIIGIVIISLLTSMLYINYIYHNNSKTTEKVKNDFDVKGFTSFS
ncbi:hypothetical protein [Sulfurisphaera ohwakuensis]|uniref:Uncharacterized protein n=1 Tax=Sulfurisphaera ohwakuensis TaxID=69656 RepID=A0A7J9RR55_SULOH|nr:hypothetical protein [Sulfurisphaera ohwakuensis]MBB5253403.1 hypothetical protein [Sulfurisphaera ohwakuensis]